MHSKRPSSLTASLWCMALAVMCLVAVPRMADASKSNPDPLLEEISMKPDIFVPFGKGIVFPLEGDVSDVMIANSGIAEITPLKSGQIYIVGMAVGDTNIITVDPHGNVIAEYDLHVKYDTQAVENTINRLFPDEKVSVEAVHDQILLTGTVSSPENSSKIANLVGHYVSDLQDKDKKTDELISNLLSVRGSQQVMLRVKIAEVSRTMLKELGVETSINDPNELSAINLFGRDPSSSLSNGSNAISNLINGQTGLTEDPIATGGLLFDSGIRGIGMIDLLINALERENYANVLAEPNLTAISGEQAGFLAGGEFPVPVGRDQQGNVTIEFRPFGVSLNFVPKVLSEGRISLQLKTEVSSLDYESAVTLAEINVPGLDIRRAETTVEMPSGGSLMIGGLLQSESIKGLSGLPGIMNTPVLGDLVKSDSFQRNETELVVMVTAYLVDPYADKEQAEVVPRERTSHLARAFTENMRRSYGEPALGVLEQETGQIGYMIR